MHRARPPAEQEQKPRSTVMYVALYRSSADRLMALLGPHAQSPSQSAPVHMPTHWPSSLHDRESSKLAGSMFTQCLAASEGAASCGPPPPSSAAALPSGSETAPAPSEPQPESSEKMAQDTNA